MCRAISSQKQLGIGHVSLILELYVNDLQTWKDSCSWSNSADFDMWTTSMGHVVPEIPPSPPQTFQVSPLIRTDLRNYQKFGKICGQFYCLYLVWCHNLSGCQGVVLLNTTGHGILTGYGLIWFQPIRCCPSLHRYYRLCNAKRSRLSWVVIPKEGWVQPLFRFF